MFAVLAFLLTIGILVVVHEYGHYLFARLFNVKILTFSVGFGPKLFSFNTKSNEWRLSLIPFGGYVRMLDEREGIVNDNEKHLAFNNKPPSQKILIAFAGPLFNILFAIFVYYIIALIGVTQVKPIIASINSNLLQETLQTSIVTPSRIVAIDGRQPKSWGDADKAFNKAIMSKPQFNIELQSSVTSKIQTVQINGALIKQHFNSDAYLETMGVYPIRYIPTISYIEPHSVADAAGLKIDDKITAINSKAIANWFQVADIIHSAPGVALLFKINRGGHDMEFSITPTAKNDNNGIPIGIIGVMPAIDQNLLQQSSYVQKYDMFHSLKYAFTECYRMIEFNLYSIYQIITGAVSPYNLGGPVTIAKIGGIAIHDGIVHFGEFLALISIGLAIMNLLPIPVLDGGHILIYLIELFTNKPLPISVVEFIFKLGFIFVMGLSLFAIYNDIMRL